jgi:hypothetical protein
MTQQPNKCTCHHGKQRWIPETLTTHNTQQMRSPSEGSQSESKPMLPLPPDDEQHNNKH